MNDRQENKFTMYKAVSDLLDVNTAKTAAMSAFATALTNFKKEVLYHVYAFLCMVYFWMVLHCI